MQCTCSPSKKRPLPIAMQLRIFAVVVSTRAITPHRIMPPCNSKSSSSRGGSSGGGGSNGRGGSGALQTGYAWCNSRTVASQPAGGISLSVCKADAPHAYSLSSSIQSTRRASQDSVSRRPYQKAACAAELLLQLLLLLCVHTHNANALCYGIKGNNFSRQTHNTGSWGDTQPPLKPRP